MFLAVCSAPLTAQTNSSTHPGPSAAERLAQWKQVNMPFHSAGLSAPERQMVEKLVDASQLLDDIYWRQSDLAGLALYKTTQDPVIKRLLMIMGCRWDLLAANSPFIGEMPMPPGHELYPHDLTREQIEHYVQQHPEQKAALYNSYTVVERQNGKLAAIPYHERYKQFLEPMARDLRDAAALSPDAAFAKFLRLRADALLSDDYYQSDLAWLDLKDPRIDVVFAPYETYLDDLLGIKTSYGASVLVRNEEESRKLAVYQQYVPAIQDALPIDAAAKPSKHGHLTPMEVMDAPFRAGDLRHGYQAVADNLPNDARIHQEKGTKKIFFKNFMDARVTEVILPIAKLLMQPGQAEKASAEGYMASTLLHEISHELGPAFARQNGKQVDIREAIGPAYSGLEEAKADVTGMFALAWLVNHGALPKERLPEYYASYAAGIFRTLRFGTGEAHGRAETMEFNYLAEQGALTLANGRYVIDYARMPAALAQLCKELLQMEDAGDRRRAEAWFTKYDKIPAALQHALAATAGIPVDLDPVFSFPDKVQ
ncbi:MAG: Zn-dependent hydrolase [Bryobacteraceae bacterium]